MYNKTNIEYNTLISWLGITKSKYYNWNYRLGKPNEHNGQIPRKHWILPWEREAIIEYARKKVHEGYRRLTYMMLDEDVAAVSPATVYSPPRRIKECRIAEQVE